MITVTEIRSIADTLSVAPAVVDHDYVLGCLLHYLSIQLEVQQSWVFKGGTSLKKCYFAEYRFSEGLDFTALQAFGAPAIQSLINEAKNVMQESLGVRVDAQETEVETIADDYGKESYEAKLYYEGPWKYGGTPRSLRIHISRDEQLFWLISMLLRFSSDDQNMRVTGGIILNSSFQQV